MEKKAHSNQPIRYFKTFSNLVEVIDEIIEVLLMSFRSQALSADPLDVVLLVDAVVVLHLLRQQLVTIVTQQFYGFLGPRL
jgi:hypothetical protein